MRSAYRWMQLRGGGARASRRWLFLSVLVASSWHLHTAEEPPITNNDFMCQCEFKDNNWVHQMNDILKHVQNLPVNLQDPEHPSTKWVMAQTCDEEATVFPNTELILDSKDVVKLRDLAVFPSSGGRLEVHHLCFPGQVAMAMVCAQQWLVRRSLMGLIKWVGKMTELLSVVHECMDAESPLPLRAADFKAYMTMFQAGTPRPESPTFIQDRAFPANAAVKTYQEAPEPLHECLPFKDPTCFPRNTPNLFESCTECCHPKKGKKGEVQCWVGPYTFQRCCHISPRPWKIDVEESQCRVADELNKDLRKGLQDEMRKVKDLGKQTGSLKEELNLCTKDGENKVKLLASKEADISALHLELDKARLELKEFQTNETEARSTVDLIKDQLSSCNSEVQAKDKQIQMQQDDASKLQADLSAKREKVEQLREQLELVTDNASQIQASLENRSRSLELELQVLLEEVQHFRMSKTETQVSVEQCEEKLATCNTQAAAKDKKMHETQGELDSFKEQHSICESQSKAKDEQIQSWRNEHDHLKADLKKTIGEKQACYEQLEVANDRANKAEEQHTLCSAQSQAKEEHIESLQRDVGTLKADLLKANGETQTCHQQAAEAGARAKQIEDECQKKMSRAQSKFAHCEKQQAACNTQAQAKDGQIQARKAELARLKEDLQRAFGQLREVNEQAGQARDTAAETQAMLERRNRVLIADLNSSRQHNQELQATLLRDSTLLPEAQQNHSICEERSQRKDEQLHAQKDELAEIKASLEKAQEELRFLQDFKQNAAKYYNEVRGNASKEIMEIRGNASKTITEIRSSTSKSVSEIRSNASKTITEIHKNASRTIISIRSNASQIEGTLREQIQKLELNFQRSQEEVRLLLAGASTFQQELHDQRLLVSQRDRQVEELNNERLLLLQREKQMQSLQEQLVASIKTVPLPKALPLEGRNDSKPDDTAHNWTALVDFAQNWTAMVDFLRDQRDFLSEAAQQGESFLRDALRKGEVFIKNQSKHVWAKLHW